MNIKRSLLTGALVVTVLLWVSSIAAYLHFSRVLDIDKIVLKQNITDITNQPFEFTFQCSKSGRYNFFLYISREGADFSPFLDGSLRFVSHFELTDGDGSVVKKTRVDHNNRFHVAGGKDGVHLNLFSFAAQKGGRYRFRMEFHSDDALFKSANKQMYLEEDYDPPAHVYVFLFRGISLIVFVLTSLPILAVIITHFWKRRKNKQRSQKTQGSST